MNRNFKAYKTGRLFGKLVLVAFGYFMGKRRDKKPMKDSFTEKP